ncbi:hypothetical protein DIPPA_33881 [Diplonema papillatum]|nr:hypothetical protein DIPPA_33881 [Diplonema papillatum]
MEGARPATRRRPAAAGGTATPPGAADAAKDGKKELVVCTLSAPGRENSQMIASRVRDGHVIAGAASPWLAACPLLTSFY